MSESRVLKSILLRCCRGAVRLFRNNCALAYVGTPVRAHKSPVTVTLYPGDVLLRKARPLHAGLHKGSGDLIGWRTLTITPDMAGMRIAQFVSIEVKDENGRVRPEQKIWADVVTKAGGLSVVARSPEEAAAVLDNPPQTATQPD